MEIETMSIFIAVSQEKGDAVAEEEKQRLHNSNIISKLSFVIYLL